MKTETDKKNRIDKIDPIFEKSIKIKKPQSLSRKIRGKRPQIHIIKN